MAYRLSVRKKQMLVAIHVLSVMAWFGGTCCMLLLGWSMRSAENGPQLLYTLSSMHIVDEALLKYPALVALISGVLLSVWTNWGLTKYYWVLIKLILTVGIMPSFLSAGGFPFFSMRRSGGVTPPYSRTHSSPPGCRTWWAGRSIWRRCFS